MHPNCTTATAGGDAYLPIYRVCVPLPVAGRVTSRQGSGRPCSGSHQPTKSANPARNAAGQCGGEGLLPLQGLIIAGQSKSAAVFAVFPVVSSVLSCPAQNMAPAHFWMFWAIKMELALAVLSGSFAAGSNQNSSGHTGNVVWHTPAGLSEAMCHPIWKWPRPYATPTFQIFPLTCEIGRDWK